MRFLLAFVGLAILAIAASARPVAAWTESTLLSVNRPCLDLGLLSDKNGALYGTRNCHYGTIFELIPPKVAGNAWSSHVLYKFSSVADGEYPEGGMVMDSKGALYGTTETGGAAGDGTIFMLTPPSVTGGAWTKTTLHNFAGGADGSGPRDGLLKGSSGEFYGVTAGGGNGGGGTVFMLTRPATSGGVWTETVLYAFGGTGDGNDPFGGLLKDSTGSLYGVTLQGGVSSWGTVFKLSPPTVAGGTWTETVLHEFNGGTDGVFPNTRLLMDKSGALYGTTNLGGGTGCVGDGCGIIFKLTPPAAPNGSWTETVLYRFIGGSDGGYPQTNLVKDGRGGFYGTTTLGGTGGCSSKYGCGTAFQLSKPTRGNTSWTETVLYNFGGDVSSPWGHLFEDTAGALYGTTSPTVYMCKSQCETVFKLAP